MDAKPNLPEDPFSNGTERPTKRQWGQKCTQKSDRCMRYIQKNGNVKWKRNWCRRDRPSDSGAESRKTKAQLMQERSTERQWGRKCTQKSDRRMRYMQKNGNVKRKLNWSMRDLRRKLRKHMLKHNWIPSDTGPGGNRTPDRPWPTVLHLLSGTLTGEKRIFPKKVLLFWENQKWFYQNSSKISTSAQGAQEAQT